jgi:hypothetical protein
MKENIDMAADILPATGTRSLHPESTATRFMTGAARFFLASSFSQAA